MNDLFRWGSVTSVSPLLVRFDGDEVDTPVSLRNPAAGYVVGSKVAVDKRGSQWVVAYVIAVA